MFSERLSVADAVCAIARGFHEHHPDWRVPGAGRPEAVYFMERLIDTAAREMSIDRIELRAATAATE